MQKKNVLLICGGGGAEHEISLQSASYILEKLKLIPTLTPLYLCITPEGDRLNLEGQKCELRKAGEVYNRETEETTKLDYAIPCIHGPPGENGQIQSVFELMGLPYLGAGPEASLNCFNKVTTKLWLSSAGIQNSPYTYVLDQSPASILKAQSFMKAESPTGVFVKAASQGSSIGCYKCTELDQLESFIEKALHYSDYILIEKALKARELEVAVYEYRGEVVAGGPGEITCTSEFYSYDEKYLKGSTAKTNTNALNLESTIAEKVKAIAIQAFKTLKIKDMARVDFFLTQDSEIYLNEINTFPGHTQISMFPTMLESSGLKYEEFIKERIFTHQS